MYRIVAHRSFEGEGRDSTEVAVALEKHWRRVVNHAPFKTERPEPDFEGHVVGNREPLPERFLAIIRELLFLPHEQRAAMFAENEVDEPAAASDADAEGGEFRFGFNS